MKTIRIIPFCLFILQLIQAQDENGYNNYFHNIKSRVDTLGYYASSWPPNIEDSLQLIEATKMFNSIVKDCEAFAEEYPDTASIKHLLGSIYQMGHNLDIEDSWDKAESSFEDAIDLNEDSPDSYFSLGLLYVNTNPKYASKAEKLFHKAINLSKNNPNPYIYQALAYAHVYQGENKDALIAIDEFIFRVPDNKQGIAFKNMILNKIGQ